MNFKGLCNAPLTVRALSEKRKTALRKSNAVKSNDLISFYLFIYPLLLMSVMAFQSTLPALYILKNTFYFTCSLYLQEDCTSSTQHNITNSLLMEAIHHVKFKGHAPCLCFTVTLPGSNTLPPICPRPSTSVILQLTG